MKNKDLQEYLKQFNDELPVKLLINSKLMIDFTNENLLLTSETAHVNPDANVDEFDHEDGKIELGNGPQFLLLNPIIT